MARAAGEDYKCLAMEARLQAARAHDPAMRTEWMRMASIWELLASQCNILQDILEPQHEPAHDAGARATRRMKTWTRER